MLPESYQSHLDQTLSAIRSGGFWKDERPLAGPQGASVSLPGHGEILNLCSNNYLGLANHPRVREAARAALDERGFGLASVRFICGTQDLHKELEKRIAGFLGMEDCLLYPSCFDANGGLFETLLGPEDAVISDALNHASIIDGIRLCKAARHRYANGDMAELESCLRRARETGARHLLVATDGVFSMDGLIADLPAICDLAERYEALVMVDDSHATGLLGPHGRGSHQHHGVMGRVDIVTGTLGKALGGGSGGFTCAPRAIVELLRQRSRPYLFSNTIAPPMVAAALEVFELLEDGADLRARLWDNTGHFRRAMTGAGFEIAPSETPIVPVMFHEARPAVRMAECLLGLGVHVVAFSYPVVPEGQARIRCQLSAAHSREDLDRAVKAFVRARAELS